MITHLFRDFFGKMGNAIPARGHGHVKIMKLSGEVMKLKVPVTVDQIIKDYPGYAILHSDAVRHIGVRAKPLDGSANLKAKHLYFLVEMPKLEKYQRAPRRVRSGITMNAKSKLESMVLARRSISDITPIDSGHCGSPNGSSPCREKGEENGALRLKVRLTRAQLAKMMAESQDSSETAEKIVKSCLKQAQALQMEMVKEGGEQKQGSQLPWKPALRSIPETCKEAQVNRVRFLLPQNEQVF